MKKRNVWMTVLLILLSLCLAVTFVSCMGDDNDTGDGGEDGTPEKGFTISCPTEMLAGDRVEITITKHGDIELRDKDYEWKIVGENTVGGTFETEDLDKEDDYTNKFFRATIPGKVKIQAVNTTSGVFTSNEVEITVKGYGIKSVDDLLSIANSDKAYVLEADIDLSHENNWEPIKGFKGVLEGNGHKISNLVMNNFVSDLGLFDVLEGTVQNLTIENVQITARGDAGNAGAVAGTNKGTISGVTVKGNVAPEYYDNVGGLVGYNDGGFILNCVNEATVKGKNNVGGIVGKMSVSANEGITGCQNKGTVTGQDSVGGVIGFLTSVDQKSNPTYTVSNQQNTGAVVGANNVGGVVGEVFGMDYYSSWTQYYSYFDLSVLSNSGEVSGDASGSNVGGVLGKATRLNILSSCENKADVSGGICVGGIVGYAPGTNVKATGAANNNVITGRAKVGGVAGHTGVIENAVNNGEIIATGILVENDKSCAYVGGIAGYCTGVVGCENNADITVTGEGIYVGGIAGYVIIADNDKVNNNINYGAISGKNQVGGIIGYLTSANVANNLTYTLSNNENKGAIAGDSLLGGIFGEVFGMDYYSSWTQYYCYFEMMALTNTAPVTGSATGSYVGGLIGKATRLKVLSAGENTANVSGGDYVGGFVGSALNANIKASGFTNNKTISGKYKVGGFAGEAGLIEYAVNRGTIVVTGPNASGEACIGGIAGYCTGVVGCKNYSNIEIENAGKYVGGIAGYIHNTESNKVNDNENYGAIKGAVNVGGIAGYMTMPSVNKEVTHIASNNKNQNTVSGTTKVGGIFGETVGMFYDGGYSTDYYGYFEVINCVNEAEITGSSYVGGIVGAYTRLKTDDNVMNTNTTTHGDKLGQ